MPRLGVSLLGPFQVTRDARPLSGLAYDKVRALLAYLVVESDRPWRRESLAALLWPDQDERAARHSLSQALWNLRRALDERDADLPLLLVTSDTVQLNPAAGIESDLGAFSALLDACEAHPHRDATRCRACARRNEQAVDLYDGDLLEGFSLPDSVLFDEWLLVRREQVRARALTALGRLALFLEGRGDLERAATHARRLIALDPWREDAVRQLMRLLAWSGQRASAIEHYERFRQRLADEIGVEPERATIDLGDRIRDGLETRPQSARTVARRREIPERLTSFVGRERELGELGALLLDGSCRLITLTGPGGIGKTRLAIEAAWTAGESFADGVVFVPLAGLASARPLASEIGSALGVPLAGGDDEREALPRWLRERELLLVLDNVEHLLAGVDLIADILDRAPDVQLLVTSRERLDLHGEWVVEVGGLGLADDAGSPGPADAEQLFMQRGRQVRAGFAPDPGEREAIRRLCRLVEGMPLAIEIAAGWLPVLSSAEIAAEVERHLDFLASSLHDIEPRHQSMRAVFDRSWALLGEPEQRAFRRLALFQGGFRRAAAEAVAGASLAPLSSLARKSLLRRTSDGRYELHELLRQYARERLSDLPGEAAAIRERHADFFTDLIARLGQDLRGARQQEALAELEAEIENLRAALLTATEDVRAGLIAESVYGFWLFCEITGRNREIQSVLRGIVDALNAGDDDDQDTAPRSLALGRALILAGATFVRTGEHEEGDALVERGLSILRCLDATGDIGLGLNFRAAFAHQRRDDERERRLLRESIEWSTAAGDRWTMAYSLNDLGLATLVLGDAGEALRLHQESLAIFRELSDRRGIGFALHNLGVVARHRGDGGAADLLDEALAIRRSIRHVWGIADTHVELGIVAREAGDREQAAGHFRDGLRVAAATHATPAVLRALAELAEMLIGAGEEQRAACLLSDILRHPRADAQVRNRAGDLLVVAGGEPPGAVVALAPIEDVIDAQVVSFLQHDPNLAPAAT